MRLCLPQDDPNPQDRARQLDEQSALYRYNRSYLGALFADEVPRGEGYDAAYAAAVVANTAEILANRAAQSTRSWPAVDTPEGPPERVVSALRQRLAATAGHLPAARPVDLGGYDDLLAAVPRPLSQGRLDDDAFFAWQQIAGATPITLRGLDALPDHLALDAASYARALGDGDRLDAALAEGRLFVCDYALFDRMPTGSTDGLQKYLCAPIAVFARSPGGALRPVAIQTGQRPGPDAPLFTPSDGLAWRMAKATVCTAEINYNGVVAHLGLCHLTAEAFLCISHRTLAPAHPLLHLLKPHFHYTLAVNETARTSLVNPGGNQDRLQSGTLEANFAVLDRALRAVRYDSIGARADVASRRVDLDRLPVYPFRDDGLPLADALHRWTDAYVRAYYADDEAVRADAELRSWASELSGPGAFGSLPALDSIAALARFVGDMLWRLTGFHAVINYGGWDHAAWAPGMPSAAFGPGPRPGATEADWFAMLPPLSVANGMLELMHTLRSIHLNRVGRYPDGHFTDPRLDEPLERLLADLDSIGADTAARDAARPWSFPFLRPERVPNSIHV